MSEIYRFLVRLGILFPDHRDLVKSIADEAMERVGVNKYEPPWQNEWLRNLKKKEDEFTEVLIKYNKRGITESELETSLREIFFSSLPEK